MTSGKADEATTLVLMDCWVRDSRKFERLIHASWLKDPWAKVLQEKRSMRLQNRISQETVPELTARYQGVLYQILCRTGVSKGQLQAALAEVWQLAQTSVRTSLDFRRVPEALWTACCAVRPGAVTGAAAALKPKLMLRAFVDEIPSSDERGTLRALAYDFEPTPPRRSREAARAFRDGLELLHQQVLRRSGELEILTDGALSPEQVATFSAPFQQYSNWLLTA